jgi:hypothetical protein
VKGSAKLISLIWSAKALAVIPSASFKVPSLVGFAGGIVYKLTPLRVYKGFFLVYILLKACITEQDAQFIPIRARRLSECGVPADIVLKAWPMRAFPPPE